MGSAEEAAKAIQKFYDALEDLLRGRGTALMNEVWHHGDYVTTAHPFGHWARGWTEVWATWEEGAAVFATYQGHATRTDLIGSIHDLKVAVHGDAAHSTGVYKSRLYMSEGPMDLRANCTNVAHRIDGVWKLVLHHADQAPPEWNARIGKMVESGRS
ncbi:MAG TPA: nuclear transport factor 2 family protein [Polyangiaceae bacterium]|nr:nuclear transport factor 2 family protein [Polyangiaceae bacterium]